MGLAGVEPATSPLSGVRSSHLSYKPAPANIGKAGRGREYTGVDRGGLLTDALSKLWPLGVE